MDWGPGYREQPPPAGLLPSVACLWARVVGPPADAVAEVLPDACVDLIWEQGRGLFVAGPDTGPVPSATPAGTVLAAVRFAPGAAGPALGLPMSELLNQRVDAADLGTGPATELARALPGSLAPAQALRVLARMTGAITAEGPADPLAAHAARMLSRNAWTSASGSCGGAARPPSATGPPRCAGCSGSGASWPGPTPGRPAATWPPSRPNWATPTRRTSPGNAPGWPASPRPPCSPPGGPEWGRAPSGGGREARGWNRQSAGVG